MVNIASDSDEEYDFGECGRPRKRQRLTHLTPSEKLQRRKLKNRVAAQAARDRKKAYMDELELVTEQLRAENRRLSEENKLLREAQSCPNCSANTTVVMPSALPKQSSISTLVKSESTSKSAVLSPQQKEQVQTLLVLMMTCYTLTCLMNCNNCTSISCKTRSPVQPQPLDLRVASHTKTKNSPQNMFQPWWGPQQSFWNPTKTM